MSSLRTLFWLPRILAITLISLYQRTLSPDHGPLRHLYPYGYCRHEPTCSEYAKTVFAKRGFLLGLMLTTMRILRCNPFARVSEKKWAAVSSRTLR